MQGEARLLRSLNPLRGEELAKYRKENRVARLTNDRHLLLAAREGKAAWAEALLREGANVNARDENGLTPLMHAAARGDAALVRLFLDKGADTELQKWNLDFEDDDGTALMLAAAEGHVEAAGALLEGGADVEQEDNVGMNALMYAAEKGKAGVVKLLVEKGANIAHRSGCGATPLMSAAKGGDISIFQFLLDHNANMQEKGKTGWTPLFYAAFYTQAAMTEYLISKGADPNVYVEGVGTALDAALENRNSRIIAILKKHMARSKFDPEDPAKRYP